MSARNQSFSIISSLIAISGALLLAPFLSIDPVLAQPIIPQPNPLEISERDPLLPGINRALTPFEIRRLKEALERLNLEAKAQLDAGNEEKAFTIWYRELRLRRTLGDLEEIQALGRVGGIAWDEMRTPDLKIITERLNEIQKEAEKEATLTPVLLNTFAKAYKKIHNLDNSIDIDLKVLNKARQEEDILAEEEALKNLGQFYLSKFDYPNAAIIYEELLDRAQAKKNTFEEGVYLQTLSEIYTQALQPENSVKIKEDLVENYLNNQKITSIPPVKISIGIDYETLKQFEKASQNYQEAFSLAWALQEYGAAGQALTRLGELYQSTNQDSYALQIYQELLKVEQQSYNYYGLMTTYDRIGQIHLKQKQYPQALEAFREGLTLARSISYQVDYFQAQIQQVNTQMQSGN